MEIPDDAHSFARFVAERAGLHPAIAHRGISQSLETGAPIGDLVAGDLLLVLPLGIGLSAADQLPRSHDESSPPARVVVVVDTASIVARDDAAELFGYGAPVFRGELRTGEAIAVFEDPVRPLSPRSETPSDFQVIAVMLARNEDDIMDAALTDLHQQGVLVHVIDNWSEDATYDIAQDHRDRGVIAVERFPQDGPTDRYDSIRLLQRVEEIAALGDANWYIKHDVDEIRRSPWPDLTLRDAIHRVEAAGFDGIDFTVANFPPVDESFVAGTDHVRHFRYFDWGRNPGDFVQIKAWRSSERRVDLLGSGAHRADGAVRRPYPYKFLLCHYPVRSQAHGERKYFVDRRPRLHPDALSRGWHSHYQAPQEDHGFLRSESSLHLFDESFYGRFLVERLSGVGIMGSGELTAEEQLAWAEILRGDV